MEYKSVTFQDFKKDPALYCDFPGLVWMAKKGKRKRAYHEIYAGFDIETWTDPDLHTAYMYIWQFSLYGKENYIIYGRTWSDFVTFINILVDVLGLTNEKRLIVWDFNFGFEFQYLKRWFKWGNIFAKEPRQPLYAILEGGTIEFRDAQAVTGGSLAFLAKSFTETQKAVGDLDYTVPRNYKTPLTEKELGYCFNDVAILAEFSKYIFDTYIKPEKYIPMTKTGFLRREVKKRIGKNFDIMREVYRCYPENLHIYTQLMEWCFRGGYTHANLWHAGRVIEGIHARDITSSYPYVMLTGTGYPVSPLKLEDPALFYQRIYDGKSCVMFIVNFINIEATTNHSLESASKCLDLSNNAIIDNGRVRRAGFMRVFITEIDFYMYELYYKWDSMKVDVMYTAKRGRLPRYLLMPMAEAYQKKAEMKKAGLSDSQEYASAKSLVNSSFGMCCTRLVLFEVKMSQIDYQWYLDGSGFNYEKERKKAFLLPQWGIYICAFARERILRAIYECGNDALYTDTDSIKYLGDHETYFNAVNAETEAVMRDTCKQYALPFEHFSDLGSFEKEYGGREVKGKFLGAKRYIVTDQGKDIVTIAGLPKGSLQEYCSRTGQNIYDVFSDQMLMKSDVSCKNAHCYNDEPHQGIVAGEWCAELSSVGIYPIDFTMKLNDYYLSLIQNINEERAVYEKRIY